MTEAEALAMIRYPRLPLFALFEYAEDWSERNGWRAVYAVLVDVHMRRDDGRGVVRVRL